MMSPSTSGRRPGRRGAGVRIAAIVVVGMALGAACSTDEGAGDPPATSSTTTTSTPPTTTEPPPPTDEELILDAYRGYWDTWLAANDPPDPNHPGLDRYYTGRSLERARASIAENAAQGHVLRLREDGQYEHRASVRSIDGDRAVVEDCAIDDGLVIDSNTGAIIDDSVSTRVFDVLLVRVNDVWVIEDVTLSYEWQGVDGCANE